MGDISARLSRHEFACKCGCGFHTVDIGVPPILEACADHFQSQEMAERCYIIINSGCRCREYNEVVQKIAFAAMRKTYTPYSSRSRHMRGCAADFHLLIKRGGYTYKVDPVKVHGFVHAQYPNQFGLGLYTGFTHLDMDEFRRW